MPKYRRQKRTTGPDLAFVEIHGQRIYLGAHGTPESRARYRRALAESKATGGHAPLVLEDLTVTELLARFLLHAIKHYTTQTGKPSSELGNFKALAGILRDLYGTERAEAFGPLALKACREKMIERGWMRKTINANVGRVRRIFRWGVENELVPAATYQALCAVPGLQRGRTTAKDGAKVRPAGAAEVAAVKARAGSVIAAMIDMQLLTGARPGEVCIMRPMDIDQSGTVWVYRPATHKNAHREQSREIFIGPKAQAVLARFLLRDRAAYCFVPLEAEQERHRSCRTHRHQPNQKPRTGRRLGPHYTTASYRRCIERACEAARVADWTPHRLRHTAATELRRLFGLDTARIILGHESADTTEIYAEADRARARAVMEQVG